MGKRGPKPKRIISEDWSPGLAYAVGLIATDGCLATGAPLIDLTSKDKDQLLNFNKALGADFYIGTKRSGTGRLHYRIQIKNVLFYEFLLSLGLRPAKSKTLGALRIPDKYYFEFLRGVFDGDGYSYSYFDPRWRSSFMSYVAVSSSSRNFIEWIRANNRRMLSIRGHITITKTEHYQLKYAKREALVLLRNMYKNPRAPHLARKRLKIAEMLAIIGARI